MTTTIRYRLLNEYSSRFGGPWVTHRPANRDPRCATAAAQREAGLLVQACDKLGRRSYARSRPSNTRLRSGP